MTRELERELADALLEASKQAARLLRYYPRNFLDMLKEHGAIRTCIQLVLSPKMTTGLLTLYEKGRLDLSIEAVILENEFKLLFEEHVLDQARRNLKTLGYEVKEFQVSAKELNWSDEELKSAVLSYLKMLNYESSGAKYNKREEIASLMAGVLHSRSKGSIERRMQNISHILEELCVPWIDGYKPLSNVGQGVKERIKRILFETGFLEKEVFEPTHDEEELDERVRQLMKNPFRGAPVRKLVPKKIEVIAVCFERDPLIKAWVLKYSNGKCESCENDAPFITSAGLPYLEVHHVNFLSSGGIDSIENTIAVCPNCHRGFHYANNAEKRKLDILSKVSRLRS